MDESLRKRTVEIFEKDQKQLEGAYEPQSDVKAVGIVSSTTIEQNDDGTYKKTVKEENAEDLYYDGGVVGKVENQLKEDAETLQAFCKEFDNKVISFNAQINAKKQEIVTLSSEAIARNCWPGIAYTAPTAGAGVRPVVAITSDFSSPYTIIEDRVAMEIYKKMAGPDVSYSAENPFEPNSVVTLTSTNSGFGYENHRDNGRLQSGDAATEIEAGDYNVGGGGDGSKEYLDNFESSSNVGTGRDDIAGIATFHHDSGFPRAVTSAGINTSWWYAGVGVAPDATDTSMTGNVGATRCVAIASSITTLISEIQTLRTQRDAAVNTSNLNKVKDKKMEKELQNWGAENIKEKQNQRKTSNEQVISAVNNL